MPLKSIRFRGVTRLEQAATNSPPLRKGDGGSAVALIQEGLIELGYPMPVSIKKTGYPDGLYGSETAGAVREFQRDQGLGKDGVVGKNTMARLDHLLPGPPASTCQHKIRLHFRSIATPNVPEFDALLNAQRVYGQYGIRVEYASGMSLLLDPTEALTLDVVDGHCKWDSENDERDLLHGIGGRIGIGPFDIVVYYVNRLRKPDGSFLNGCAGHKPAAASVAVASGGSPWTLAHEVGHVLLSSAFAPVHSSSTSNVMFTPTTGITASPPGFSTAQLRQIRKSPFLQSCPNVCMPL